MPEQSKAEHYLMQFFNYSHLPDHLQETSKRFHELAVWVETWLPTNQEQTVALRKLLEAKDCAVRSSLSK
jgi:hypothetical protein